MPCANCVPILSVSVSVLISKQHIPLTTSCKQKHGVSSGHSEVVGFRLSIIFSPPRGKFSHLMMFRLGSVLFIPAYLSVILYRPFASAEDDGNFLVMAGEHSNDIFQPLLTRIQSSSFVSEHGSAILWNHIRIHRHIHPSQLQFVHLLLIAGKSDWTHLYQ